MTHFYWLGPILGSYIGHAMLGPLGGLLGFFGGWWAEAKIRGDAASRRPGKGAYGRSSSNNLERVFCASVAAMLAKLAKADGHVSHREIDAVERAFARLGFSKYAREYAVDVFRKAKDDNRSIYDYALEFTSVVRSIEVRELLYELLWDLACADGRPEPVELTILSRLPRALRIPDGWYELFYRERMQASSGSSGGYRGASAAPADDLASAYTELGVDAHASNDAVKKAYRDKAKKFHPDALRAQGFPDEMIGKANERMARINAAWSKIRAARGI